MKFLTSLIALLLLFYSPLFAENSLVEHSHESRLHSHPLPVQGVAHRHSNGALGQMRLISEKVDNDGLLIKTDSGIFTYNEEKYYISQSVIKSNNKLIKLILNTESMNHDERQYWFDIMPSMTKKQIDGLYEILETERKKLAELGVKYFKEIKLLNEKHLVEFSFFQFEKNFKKNKQNGKISNMFYLEKDIQGVTNIKISRIEKESKINAKDILLPLEIGKLKESKKIRNIEEMILLQYCKEVFRNKKRYIHLYGDDLIKGYENIATNLAIKHGDLEVLSLTQSGSGDINILLSEHRGDFVKVAEAYKKDINDLNKDLWKRNLIRKLYKLTMWRRDSSCSKLCSSVLSMYIQKMKEEKYPFSIKSTNNLYIYHILFDFFGYFNDDLIDKDFSNLITKFNKNNYDKISKDANDLDKWQSKITKAFFEKKLDSIYLKKLEEYKALADSRNTDLVVKSLSLEGKLLESGTYLAFSYIKDKKFKDALEILVTMNKIGSSYQSSAYSYIERKMVGFLLSATSSSAISPKGIKDLEIVSREGGKRIVKKFGKKYAITIGVSDYAQLDSAKDSDREEVLYDLKYAHKDARAFRNFIADPIKSGGRWEIKEFLNHNAKKLNVRKAIDEVLTKALPDDLVYIFFSGHARTSTYDTDEVYLLTHDLEKSNPYSGIPYDWFLNKVQNTAAKHVVVFIDACRSGQVSGQKGEGPFDQALLAKIKKVSPTKVIFTSGSSSQVSYEDDSISHGVFSYYLLKGISGEASDENKDGYVNINELERYTSTKVVEHTLNSRIMNIQEPRIHNFNRQYSTVIPISIRN